MAAAVQWWQRAGRRAFSHATYMEAATHFTRGLDLLTSMPASAERDQQELALEVELGYALIPVRGWSAAETARAFTRAGELCRQSDETPVHFRALWGLGAFHFVRGDQRQARQVAEHCLLVAGQGSDADAIMEAHYLSGITACVMGEFAAGQSELEECVRIYGTGKREAHRILYGQDVKASALGWLAMARWACGRPDEALECANEGWNSFGMHPSHSCLREAWLPSDSCTSFAGTRRDRTLHCRPRLRFAPSRGLPTSKRSFRHFTAPISYAWEGRRKASR